MRDIAPSDLTLPGIRYGYSTPYQKSVQPEHKEVIGVQVGNGSTVRPLHTAVGEAHHAAVVADGDQELFYNGEFALVVSVLVNIPITPGAGIIEIIGMLHRSDIYSQG